MVANQIMTESTVGEVNAAADRQQYVADNVRAAEVSVRQTQLAGRNIRLQRTPAEVEKAAAEMRQFKAAGEKQIDAALAVAADPVGRERLQKIKAQMENYASGVEELAKVQSELFLQTDKRSAISAEWEKAFAALLASPALAGLANRGDVEMLLHQADSKVNRLGAAAWRLGATGEESQKEVIARSNSLLHEDLGRIRDLADDTAFRKALDALASIVTRFTAVNDAIVKLEDSRAEIIKNRTAIFVNQAVELIEAQVAFVQAKAKASKARAIAEAEQANRINFGLAIVVVIAIIGSVLFSFMGIARPMTRLNGALGAMAAGHLDIVIPGANRGDEIGDLAKTVTVIRENAEQKARDEAEAKSRQDQVAVRQRKADMVKLADDFEAAVGEIIETVSSASTELEASATTLTSTAERAQELATMVAAASEEASTNVQSVASATEEMASSVNEISRQVQDSARMASEAVDQARKTNDRVSELSKAASRIPRRRPARSASRSRASRRPRRNRWGRSRRSAARLKNCRRFPRPSQPRWKSRAPRPGRFPATCSRQPRAPSRSLPTSPTCSAAPARPAPPRRRYFPRRSYCPATATASSSRSASSSTRCARPDLADREQRLAAIFRCHGDRLGEVGEAIGAGNRRADRA